MTKQEVKRLSDKYLEIVKHSAKQAYEVRVQNKEKSKGSVGELLRK